MVIGHHLKLLHVLTYINRFLMQPNAVQTKLRTKLRFVRNAKEHGFDETASGESAVYVQSSAL